MNHQIPSREPWWREWPLALAVATLTLALLGKSQIISALQQPVGLIAVLALICSVILTAAIAIVRHADVLAHRLGEPAGTLLLTLAITGLEVAMVAFVMSTGTDKPTLARDTMFAVVMLVLNGFMGLALMPGGLRHSEQHYNLQSANAFLVMILPLTVLGLVLPNFTHSTEGPTLSKFQMVFLSVMSVGILRSLDESLNCKVCRKTAHWGQRSFAPAAGRITLSRNDYVARFRRKKQRAAPNGSTSINADGSGTMVIVASPITLAPVFSYNSYSEAFPAGLKRLISMLPDSNKSPLLSTKGSVPGLT